MLKRLEVPLVDELALKVVAMEMGYRMSESVAALDRVWGPCYSQERHLPGMLTLLCPHTSYCCNECPLSCHAASFSLASSFLLQHTAMLILCH